MTLKYRSSLNSESVGQRSKLIIYSNWFPHNNFKKVEQILNILDV